MKKLLHKGFAVAENSNEVMTTGIFYESQEEAMLDAMHSKKYLKEKLGDKYKVTAEVRGFMIDRETNEDISSRYDDLPTIKEPTA